MSLFMSPVNCANVAAKIKMFWHLHLSIDKSFAFDSPFYMAVHRWNVLSYVCLYVSVSVNSLYNDLKQLFLESIVFGH